jgi:hypothetical protein
LSSFIGFSKGVILSRPGHPDPKRAEVLARHSFAREMLMRLPRQLEGVTLTRSVVNDSGRERLAIEALAAGGLRATLLVDNRTCVPIALQFDTVRGFVSGLARIDLSEYRPFGGIRFPTLLRTSVAGQPQEEERVTSIEVNTPTAARAFVARQ